jgi:LysR family hydrogen peroxide-inducible transcriptional activator
MNLQQLEYIIALDKYKSFSKAAEACFITQATLSTMVRKLEEELDLVLFDRKTNPIITTESGKEVITEAHKVLLHSRRLKQLSADMQGRVEGELRIGIIPTVAGNLLHRVLPSILEKFPDLTLYIQEITTANIIQQVKSGRIDVGIVSTPLNTKNLEEEILYYEKLMVYGEVQGSNTRYLTPDEFSEEKFWLLEEGNCLADQIANVCSLKSRKLNSNLKFQPNSFDSLLNIVDQMKGITLIPELYCKDLPEVRRARVKDFAAPYPVREISMVYYRPYVKPKLIEALAGEIRRIIVPVLETGKLKNSDMKIARI